jgi:hypothetical protein
MSRKLPCPNNQHPATRTKQIAESERLTAQLTKQENRIGQCQREADLVRVKRTQEPQQDRRTHQAHQLSSPKGSALDAPGIQGVRGLGADPKGI